MREEFFVINVYSFQDRITPAHAGRMITTAAMFARYGDHPRACGKNTRRGNTTERIVGSPPRMREESPGKDGKSAYLRITPAHAGRISHLPLFFKTI